MSMARECDRCGVLFKAAPGCVTVDLGVVVPVAGNDVLEQNWPEIELCLECSGPVVAHLKGACDGFDDVVAGKEGGS